MVPSGHMIARLGLLTFAGGGAFTCEGRRRGLGEGIARCWGHYEALGHHDIGGAAARAMGGGSRGLSSASIAERSTRTADPAESVCPAGSRMAGGFVLRRPMVLSGQVQ